jgi:hypothetical protein
MALFVGDFIDAEPRRVQLVESDDESAQVLLVDPFRRLPVDLCHRCDVGERHLRTEHAHIVLKPLGVGTVLVHKVQLLNATIATSTPYLPLSKDEEALLRTEIKVSDPSGIGILNGRAPLATDGAVGSHACTIQNQRHAVLIFAEIAKLVSAEIEEVSE